jgi:hypothetical protein
MTLIFVDSFDHYAFADRNLKWSLTGDQGGSLSSGNGRWGTTCLQFTHGNDYWQKTVPGAATYVVGAAHVGFGFSTSHRFFRFYDSGTEHLYLTVDGTGRVAVYRGGGTLLGTGTTALSSGVYYYLEMKATIHDSTGSVEVRVNGVTEINLTNQDTRNGATANINQIRIGLGVNQGISTHRIDDFYICDTNGSANNDFLGDVRIQALFPNGNGNSSVLVGSDANSTDNYLLVDETAPNTSDYVESSTPGDKDTYAFGNLTPTSGTVHGLQVLPFAAKTDAGVRSIASVARLSGTEEDSADKALGATYTYHPDIRETKPGGGAWSISDVNSAEFGVKVTA